MESFVRHQSSRLGGHLLHMNLYVCLSVSLVRFYILLCGFPSPPCGFTFPGLYISILELAIAWFASYWSLIGKFLNNHLLWGEWPSEWRIEWVTCLCLEINAYYKTKKKLQGLPQNLTHFVMCYNEYKIIKYHYKIIHFAAEELTKYHPSSKGGTRC